MNENDYKHVDIKSNPIKDDRHKYVGGSDFPIILGLSSYKSRWQLLLEKLEITKDNFEGNVFTDYGIYMEDIIRIAVNKNLDMAFEPASEIIEDYGVRCNVDGLYILEDIKHILEIKTGSDFKKKHKVYLAQLLFYLYYIDKSENNKDYLSCTLAFYERPDDFDTVLNENKIEYYHYSFNDLQRIIDVEVDVEVKRFWKDFETLKTFLELGLEIDETLIIDNEIQEVTAKALVLEEKIAQLKIIKKESEAVKQELFDLMLVNGIKTWTMIKNTKITRIDASVSTKKIVNIEKLQQELDARGVNIKMSDFEEEEKKYTKGHIKITLPKKRSD